MFKKLSLLLLLLSFSSLSAEQFGSIDCDRPAFAANWELQKNESFNDGKYQFSLYSTEGNEKIYPSFVVIVDQDPDRFLGDRANEAIINFLGKHQVYSILEEEGDSVLFKWTHSDAIEGDSRCVGKVFFVNEQELHFIAYTLDSNSTEYDVAVATLKAAHKK